MPGQPCELIRVLDKFPQLHIDLFVLSYNVSRVLEQCRLAQMLLGVKDIREKMESTREE
jgi:hypothetical protein